MSKKIVASAKEDIYLRGWGVGNPSLAAIDYEATVDLFSGSFHACWVRAVIRLCETLLMELNIYLTASGLDALTNAPTISPVAVKQ